MQKLSGISKADRLRLAAIVRATKGTISVQEVATILSISNTAAVKLLGRWASNGWVVRIRRGLYVLIPLESKSTDIALDDPWIIAEKIFAPCYIGGWSAAEYWGLTDQIFYTVLVITNQQPKNRSPVIRGTNFLVHYTSKDYFFGLESVWRGQIKVQVSNQTRTILDFLINPKFGGGIRHVMDMFCNYLNDDNKDLDLLINYAKKVNNGAVFKRLGFLLDFFAPNEKNIIEVCNASLTKGKAKIDSSLTCDKLVTKWQLWVPKDLQQENKQ